MSRSGYSEDCDVESPFYLLWPSIVRRSIDGKRGQSFLRELRDALEAMPSKRLITKELRTTEGEVCAIGSVGVKRGVDMSKLDVDDYRGIADAFGIAPALVREIEYENDDGYHYGGERSPEERWQAMRNWCESHLKPQEGV